MPKVSARNYRDDVKNGVCIFCPANAKVGADCGKLLTDKDGEVIVHNYCVLFASGLSQNGEDHEGIDGFLIPDIKQEYSRGRKLRCFYCTKKLATIGCSKANCRRCFHFSCGFKHEAMFLFFNTFLAYCKDHRPQQVVPITDSDPTHVTCPICMDDVEARVSNHTLKTPCCNKTWFHRRCVQHQALSAGYFFRCAICNNQEQFQQEMKQFGIYIPEHDASWEMEDHAFQDLYWRHDMCDIDPCKCPDGRKFNQASSKWELVLCDLCGSSGCHLACGGLKSASQDWACVMCSDMLSNATEVNCPSASSPQKSPSLVVDSPTRTGQTTRTAMKLMGKHPRTPLSSQTFRKKITPSPFSSTLPNSTGEPFDYRFQDFCCSAHDTPTCSYSGDSCVEPPDLSISFDYCQPSTSSQGLEEAEGNLKKGKKRRLSFCSKENVLGHSLNTSENMHFKKHCTWKTQSTDLQTYKMGMSSELTYGPRTTCRMSMRPRNFPLSLFSPLNIPVKNINNQAIQSCTNGKNICEADKLFSTVPCKTKADLLSVSLKQEVGHISQKVLTPVSMTNETVTQPVDDEPLSTFAATLSTGLAKRTYSNNVPSKERRSSPTRQSLTELHYDIPSTSGTGEETKNTLSGRSCVEAQAQLSLQSLSCLPTDVLNHHESPRDVNADASAVSPEQEAEDACHDVTGLLSINNNLQQPQNVTVTPPSDEESLTTFAATLSYNVTDKESPCPRKLKRKKRQNSQVLCMNRYPSVSNLPRKHHIKKRSRAPAESMQPSTKVPNDIPSTSGTGKETENTLIGRSCVETQVKSSLQFSSCLPTGILNYHLHVSPRNVNKVLAAISRKHKTENASHEVTGLLSLKNNYLEQLQSVTVTCPADEKSLSTFGATLTNNVTGKASSLHKVTSKVKTSKNIKNKNMYRDSCVAKHQKPHNSRKSTTAGSIPPLTEGDKLPSSSKIVEETENTLIGRSYVETQAQLSLQSSSCLPMDKSSHEPPRDMNSFAVSVQQEAGNASHDVTGLQQLKNATVTNPVDEEPSGAATLSSDVAKTTLTNKVKSKASVKKKYSPVVRYPGFGRRCLKQKKNCKQQSTDAPDSIKSPLTTLNTDIQDVGEKFERSPIGRSHPDAQAHPIDQSPMCLPTKTFNQYESPRDLGGCSAENYSFRYVWGGYDDADHDCASPFKAGDFVEAVDNKLAGTEGHGKLPGTSEDTVPLLSGATEVTISCQSPSLDQQWSPYPSQVAPTKADVHNAISNKESIREQDSQQPDGSSQELSTTQTLNCLQSESSPSKPSLSVTLTERTAQLDGTNLSPNKSDKSSSPKEYQSQETPSGIQTIQTTTEFKKKKHTKCIYYPAIGTRRKYRSKRKESNISHVEVTRKVEGTTETVRSKSDDTYQKWHNDIFSSIPLLSDYLDEDEKPENQDTGRHLTGMLLRQRHPKSNTGVDVVLPQGVAPDTSRETPEKEQSVTKLSQSPSSVNIKNGRGLEIEERGSELQRACDSPQGEISSHMSLTSVNLGADSGAVNQDRARHSTGRLLRREYGKSNIQNVLVREVVLDKEWRSKTESSGSFVSQEPNQYRVNVSNIISDSASEVDVIHDEIISVSPYPGDETEEPAMERPSSVRSSSSTEASPDSGISQGYSCYNDALHLENPSPIMMMPNESTSLVGKAEIHSCSKQKELQMLQESASIHLHDSEMSTRMMVEESKNDQETDRDMINPEDACSREAPDVANEDAKPTDFEWVEIDSSPEYSTLSECTGSISSITSVSESCTTRTKSNTKRVSTDATCSSRQSISDSEDPLSSPTIHMNANDSPESSCFLAPMPETPLIKQTQLKPSSTFAARSRHSSPDVLSSSAEAKSCPAKCQTSSNEDNSKESRDKSHRMLKTMFVNKLHSKVCTDLFRAREEQSRPLKCPRTEIPTRPDSPLVSVNNQYFRFRDKRRQFLSNSKCKSLRNPVDSNSSHTPKVSISKLQKSISPKVESDSTNGKYLPSEDSASLLPSPCSKKVSAGDPRSEKSARPDSTLLPGNNHLTRVSDKTRVYLPYSPKNRSLKEPEDKKSPQTPKESISAVNPSQSEDGGSESSYISPKVGSPRPWLLRSCSKNQEGLSQVAESASPLPSRSPVFPRSSPLPSRSPVFPRSSPLPSRSPVFPRREILQNREKKGRVQLFTN